MKKFIYTLLLSASLINVSAVTPKAELDATIDEVSAQIDNTDAKGLLAWMKNHKKTTALIGLAALAGAAVTADMIINWAQYDAKTAKVIAITDTDNYTVTWFDNTVTNRFVIEPARNFADNVQVKTSDAFNTAKEFAKNNKKTVIGGTFALVAAILVTADLTRDEKASLIRNLFAKKTADTQVVDKAENAFDKTKKFGSKAVDKAEDAFDKAKELGSTAKNKAKNAFNKTKEFGSTTKDTTEDAFDKAKDTAENAFDKTKKFGSKALDKTKEFGSKAKDAAEDAFDKAKELVTHHHKTEVVA